MVIVELTAAPSRRRRLAVTDSPCECVGVGATEDPLQLIDIYRSSQVRNVCCRVVKSLLEFLLCSHTTHASSPDQPQLWPAVQQQANMKMRAAPWVQAAVAPES